MKLVVDASVALKWFFRDRDDEPDLALATEILERFVAGEIRLLAPTHFHPEVCAVLAREAPEAMARQLSRLLGLSIPVHDDPTVLARAMELARELEHHLFDTLYHALALEEEAMLVTADVRYARKADDRGGIVELSSWRFEPDGDGR